MPFPHDAGAYEEKLADGSLISMHGPTAANDSWDFYHTPAGKEFGCGGTKHAWGITELEAMILYEEAHRQAAHSRAPEQDL